MHGSTFWEADLTGCNLRPSIILSAPIPSQHNCLRKGERNSTPLALSECRKSGFLSFPQTHGSLLQFEHLEPPSQGYSAVVHYVLHPFVTIIVWSLSLFAPTIVRGIEQTRTWGADFHHSTLRVHICCSSRTGIYILCICMLRVGCCRVQVTTRIENYLVTSTKANYMIN